MPTVISKEVLIEDLQRVQNSTEEPVTRNFYRANGEFSENAWQKHFPNFGAFLEAAFGTPEEREPVAPETSEVEGDTWTLTLPKTRIHTLEALVEFYEVDLSIWEVERFRCNKYEMPYTVGSGETRRAQIEPIYQIRADFKKKKDIIAAKAEIELLKEQVKAVARVPKSIARPSVSSGNLLEIMVPDLHAGKLCHGKETGYQDYDTSIAVETYRRAIDSLLERSKGYTFDRIVLGVGNDLLQSDNVQGTTYSGTKVDTDTRFHKTYRIVREMLSETIEKLRLIAPVDVKLVPGNHDTLSVFTLGDSLECRFHNYTDVTVDNGPILHKIVEWGNNFLLLTHGHQGKQADYGVWMASQYPKEFGRTKYREIHVGHKHKTALDEKFGIRVRTFSSLTAADAWHANNNFVGNLRTAEALVFNKEQGLIAQFYHTEAD